jgi:type I restriction enzyme S subunit
LENLEVLYPTAKLVDEFDSKAQVIDAQIKALILQNAELTCARDLLLPRLMDGRIPV